MFEHPDLHRVLLGPVAEGRDLVVARHHQPQRAAERLLRLELHSAPPRRRQVGVADAGAVDVEVDLVVDIDLERRGAEHAPLPSALEARLVEMCGLRLQELELA